MRNRNASMLFKWLPCIISFLGVFGFSEITAHSAASWQAGPKLNAARDQFAGGVIDGKIYVFGGNRYPDGANLKSTEMLDPAAGSWVYVADNEDDYGQGVEEVTGTVVNGKFYVFGGYDGGDTNINFDEVYDPTTNAWTSLAPMPTTRSGATAVAYNSKIYVFGGENTINGTKIRYTVVEVYDPGNDTWQTETHMPKTLQGFAVAVVADKAYVISGYDGSELVSDVSVYDFTTGTWTTTGFTPLPHPRVFSYASAAPVVDGKIYLIGGIEGTSQNTAESSSKVDVYDTVSNTWQTGAHLPTPIVSQFSTILNNDIYSIGGNTSASNNSTGITAVVWKYNTLGTPPGAPTNVKATATGVGQATVSFVAPTSNGGTPITGYTVTSKPAGGIDTDAGTTLTTHTVTGLANGTAYTFNVTATNAGGSTPSKASNKIKTWTVSGKPTITSLKAGDSQVSVSFKAPASNGGSQITGYTVTSNPSGGNDTNPGSTSLTHKVDNLTNGTPYTFTATATNAVGTSTSQPSKAITPATVPAPPTNVTASQGTAKGSVIVTFTATPAASDGGSPIKSYTVTSPTDGKIKKTGKSSPITVTGLSNKTSYTFNVVASNAMGNSTVASSNSVTPK